MLDGLRRLHLPPDGRREDDPRPSSSAPFQEALRKQRERPTEAAPKQPFSVRDLTRPEAAGKSPGLPLQGGLAKGKEQPPKVLPFKSRPGCDDDDRER